ncbi:hypothetical protein M8818_002479 [Zalaria obscura]|uniref:Uncharacterized protein n=1 Tax=Zalaria obscura TaxID=2024903 RepID=A0ACC3SGL1_9PEZI
MAKPLHYRFTPVSWTNGHKHNQETSQIKCLEDSSQFQLLSLPTELQIMILHQALGDIPQHGWCFRGSDGLLVHELCGPARSQPAITKVSRQIRAVALPLFYARFVFSFTRYDLVNPRRVMISHVHCLAERARLLRRIDIDFAPCGAWFLLEANLSPATIRPQVGLTSEVGSTSELRRRNTLPMIWLSGETA